MNKARMVQRELDRILAGAPAGTTEILLHSVRKLVRKHIGFDIGCIAVLEGSSEPKLLAADAAYAKILLEKAPAGLRALASGGRSEFPVPDPSFIRYVVATKQTRRSGDVAGEPAYFATRDDIRSELAVPILLDDVVLGVINLESTRPNRYSVADQRLVEFVAARIARSLSDLMAREGRFAPGARSLEAVRDLFGRIPVATAIEESGVLDQLADIVAEALHSERCAIYLHDGEHPEHPVLLAKGLSGSVPILDRSRVQPGRSVALRAFNLRQTLRDTEDGSPVIAAPLVAGGRAVGAMVVALRCRTAENPGGFYTASDNSVLEMLQIQIAAEVRLRRTEISRNERTRQISLLFELDRESGLDSVLRTAVRNIPELFNARYCSIFLLDPTRDVFVLRATRGLRQRDVGKIWYQRGQGLTGWVADRGRPLRLSDRSEDYLKTIDPSLEWKQVHPEGRQKRKPETRTFLAVPIFLDGHSIGVIRVSDRKEGVFSVLDEQILAIVASNVARYVAQVKRHEDHLQLIRNLLLADILPQFGGSDDALQSALKEAVERAAKALGASTVTLFQTNQDGTGFEGRAVAGGLSREPGRIQCPSISDDPAFWVLERGTCYWDLIPAEWRIRRPNLPPDTPGYDRFAVREKIKSAAGIRVELGKQRLGVLFFSYRKRQHFDAERRSIIETFSSQIALCLEVARLSRKMVQSGAREQADYLAREIHDAVIPILAIEIQGVLDDLKQLARCKKLGTFVHKLEDAERRLTFVSDECRDIMTLLRIPIIDELGLVGALYGLRQPRLEDCAVSFELPESDSAVPLYTKNHLYRIAQAATANIVNHAAARNVHIALEVHDDSVCLTITDDGRGFDFTQARSQPACFGLRGMEERALKLGGKFDVTSTRGQGTRVRVSIPLPGGAYVRESASATHA